MSDLRKLAEASLGAEETWHHEADLCGSLAHTYGESGEYFVAQDAAFIAAASPDVVLGLLDKIDMLVRMNLDTEEERDEARAEVRRLKADNKYKYGDGYEAAGIALVAERDEAREAVRRLAGALEKLACLGNGDRPGNSHGNVMAQKALADPVVKRIVEGG